MTEGRKYDMVSRLRFEAILFLSLCATTMAQTSPPEMHLTLPQAIDLALKQNRNLVLARLAILSSENKKTIARSYYFPEIHNSSTVLHITELTHIVVPQDSLEVGGIPLPSHDTVISQGALDTYTSGTQLVQPITQAFKIHASNQAATADIHLAQIQETQAENQIALKIRELYYGILISRLKQKAAQEDLKVSQAKQQEVGAAIQNGSALEVSSLEARAGMLNAQQAILTLTQQEQDTTLILVNVLGLPLSTHLLIESDSSADTEENPLPDRAEGLRLAEEKNTEVRTAREKVMKARAGVAVARSAYIPDITGLARYSYQSGIPFLVHNFGSFGANFNFDLFEGGRRNAQMHDAQVQLELAQTDLARLQDDVAVRVESAYNKLERVESLVTVLSELAMVRDEAARIADRQFEQSTILGSDRSQAHAQAASAEANLLEARLSLTLARNDLKQTIGIVPR
jgi:outer membrane protein TolC